VSLRDKLVAQEAPEHQKNREMSGVSAQNSVKFTPLDLDEFASVFDERHSKLTALTGTTIICGLRRKKQQNSGKTVAK
jgi:hypothetical protein